MAELYIGLLSGTSVDGIDAALVEFDDGALKVRAATITPFDPELRDELLGFMAGRYRGDAIDALGRLDRAVGEAFAGAALALLAQAGVEARAVRAIGSHGQTVRHRPPRFTLQIGDPNTLATATGIPVVGDLRRKDVALGGQGAPLVPAFHAAVFGSRDEDRAIVNVGGIANLTVLARDGAVAGGDVGPGNALLDAWCQRHTGQAFDAQGGWAASGRVDEPLLAALRSEPFFGRPAPKSTGRELFSLAWLERHLGARAPAPADVQATLVELTASTIADAVRAARVARVYLCGGGAHNRALSERLAARLPGIPVRTTAELGLDVDHVEAAAFAWLAREALAGRPGNLPQVTGASRPALLGGLWLPD
jgi:anhydro-N-acetylmuramic acid kinase